MTLKQKSQQVHTFIHLNSTSTEEPICNAGDIRDAGSIPGLRRFSRRGHGNPLQYSCLENPMDRGTWQATVYKATGLQRVGHDWSDLAHTQGISTWCLTNINPGTPKIRLHVPLPSSCPCSRHTEPASLHACLSCQQLPSVQLTVTPTLCSPALSQPNSSPGFFLLVLLLFSPFPLHSPPPRQSTSF